MLGSIKALVPVSRSFWASSRLGAVVFHLRRGWGALVGEGCSKRGIICLFLEAFLVSG